MFEIFVFHKLSARNFHTLHYEEAKSATSSNPRQKLKIQAPRHGDRLRPVMALCLWS